MMPILIYCAGGNAELVRIAYEAGWQLGVRSDKYHYPGYKLALVDVDYKKPDFEKHLARVAKEQPMFATVPDLSDKEFDLADVERALVQAERLKDYCQTVLLVPKLLGQLELIPAEYAIAFSIPTKYGGAKFHHSALTGRRVHLLGGSPQEQMRLYYQINTRFGGQVISADGNMGQKMAMQFLKYWERSRWVRWPDSSQSQYYPCWQRTCENVYQSWEVLTGESNQNEI